MKKLNAVERVALVLVVVGALNWGIVGAFNIDLVGSIFGVMTILTRVVYVLVGIAALYTIYFLTMMTD